LTAERKSGQPERGTRQLVTKGGEDRAIAREKEESNFTSQNPSSRRTGAEKLSLRPISRKKLAESKLKAFKQGFNKRRKNGGRGVIRPSCSREGGEDQMSWRGNYGSQTKQASSSS